MLEKLDTVLAVQQRQLHATNMARAFQTNAWQLVENEEPIDEPTVEQHRAQTLPCALPSETDDDSFLQEPAPGPAANTL